MSGRIRPRARAREHEAACWRVAQNAPRSKHKAVRHDGVVLKSTALPGQTIYLARKCDRDTATEACCALPRSPRPR